MTAHRQCVENFQRAAHLLLQRKHERFGRLEFDTLGAALPLELRARGVVLSGGFGGGLLRARGSGGGLGLEGAWREVGRGHINIAKYNRVLWIDRRAEGAGFEID